MENVFSEQISGIYRLRVPFENIYTSVFLIKADGKKILVDCGTTSVDVDTVIIPALKKMRYDLSDIDMLVLTHAHSDHAGGLARIRQIRPDLVVICEECALAEGVITYSLRGHTDDAIGILDERTGTLISGDGLQGAGIEKYRCLVEDKEEYRKTLERIKGDKRIESILFSHAYEPWYTDAVIGREDVEECLVKCKECIGDKK